jgi:hypothetical protein
MMDTELLKEQYNIYMNEQKNKLEKQLKQKKLNSNTNLNSSKPQSDDVNSKMRYFLN